jgi:hypothetical protein
VADTLDTSRIRWRVKLDGYGAPSWMDMSVAWR